MGGPYFLSMPRGGLGMLTKLILATFGREVGRQDQNGLMGRVPKQFLVRGAARSGGGDTGELLFENVERT